MDKITFDTLIGYEIVSITPENTTLKLKTEEKHTNIYGYIHGGAYFTLSDIASGLYVKQFEGNWVTLNANINYVKGAQNQDLTIVATPTNRSRKLCVLEVVIKDENTIFTTGTFTMYKID